MKTSNDFARLITPESINISWDGKNRIVTRDNPQYFAVLKCIQEERWDELESALDVGLAVKTYSDGKCRVEDGQVFVNVGISATGSVEEFKIPTQLNDRILFYMQQNLPFDSLINFAIKLSQNPSYNSINQLYQFIERHRFTVTEDGDFIAYKKVSQDFKDLHTGTFDNSVGKVVSMPRNQINDNPDDHCSAGLHCANYHYALGYGSGTLIEVRVNPKNVVSVPNDHNFEKMRVCEYLVLRVCDEEYKEPVYPNDNMDDDYCLECGEEFDFCDCEDYCENCALGNSECICDDDDSCQHCGNYTCTCDDDLDEDLDE